MKKIKLIMSLLLLVVFVSGCSEIKNDEVNLDGGWKIGNNIVSKNNLTKKEENIFIQATNDYTGLDLEPYALLGTQIVNGTNYMYIALGTTVTDKPVSNWKIVTIYVDLDGKVELKNVIDFNYSNYTQESIQYNDKELDGGWEINKNKSSITFDSEIKSIYDASLDNYTGVSFEPILYLGNQIVSGTNYAFLNVATTTTKEPKSYIAIVTIYNDLDNNKEITNVSYVNLADFNN